jgi:hypothetical protein
LYANSKKLKAKFERLAKQAEGETLPKSKPKEEAYSIAEFYLTEFPEGSFRVTRGDTPSMFDYVRRVKRGYKEDECLITTCSGKLEIEEVTGDSITMALGGKATKKYNLEQLNTGFKRAKADIKIK